MSALIARGLRFAGDRTTMRLEPEFWTALAEIARRENMSVSALVAGINGPGSRTSAVRVHVLRHYRDAASRRCATRSGATRAEAERMAAEITKEHTSHA